MALKWNFSRAPSPVKRVLLSQLKDIEPGLLITTEGSHPALIVPAVSIPINCNLLGS